MITGVLIIARLGSTRLHNKHLIEVGGLTYIEWLTRRFEYSFRDYIVKGEIKIIIATSKNIENLAFEKLYSNTNIDVFYGEDENIPLRQLQCAEQFKLTNIISIYGDDILCSTNGALKLYNLLLQGHQSIKTVGLPLGMNSMAYTTAFLKNCVYFLSANAKVETGWGRIFGDKIKDISTNEFSNLSDLRFTLDYIEDSYFFERIILHFGKHLLSKSDLEIVNFVRDNYLFEINSSLSDIYWENFNSQIQSENNGE